MELQYHSFTSLLMLIVYAFSLRSLKVRVCPASSVATVPACILFSGLEYLHGHKIIHGDLRGVSAVISL